MGFFATMRLSSQRISGFFATTGLSSQDFRPFWKIVGLVVAFFLFAAGLVFFWLSGTGENAARIFGKTFISIFCIIPVSGVVMAAYMTSSGEFAYPKFRSTMTRTGVMIILCLLTIVLQKAQDYKETPDPDVPAIVSSWCFTFAAMIFSKTLKLGYETGIFSYFLGCSLMMIIDFGLVYIILAAFIGIILIHIHS